MLPEPLRVFHLTQQLELESAVSAAAAGKEEAIRSLPAPHERSAPACDAQICNLVHGGYHG